MKRIITIFLAVICIFSLVSVCGCEKKEKTYTVKFVNYDGSLLKEYKNLEKWSTIEYDGETPVRPDEDLYSYEFIGWDREIEVVTKDAVYTAQYKTEMWTKNY